MKKFRSTNRHRRDPSSTKHRRRRPIFGKASPRKSISGKTPLTQSTSVEASLCRSIFGKASLMQTHLRRSIITMHTHLRRSTIKANHDLADWLGGGKGYPGKFYFPRMNSMNKLAYAAICTHSPSKPVLIFVSFRRQTRLTALDLIQVGCLLVLQCSRFCKLWNKCGIPFHFFLLVDMSFMIACIKFVGTKKQRDVPQLENPVSNYS